MAFQEMVKGLKINQCCLRHQVSGNQSLMNCLVIISEVIKLCLCYAMTSSSISLNINWQRERERHHKSQVK